VCTTELGYMAKVQPEFERRGVKIIGLSVDSTDDHEGWARDIEETQGYAPNYPIIADADFQVSKLYGMLPAEVSGDPKERTPADNQTVRNVFVIGPDKKIKLILVYPMTTGRNFDEILRVIDSLQLTANHKVATPANWTQGQDVFIAGSVTNEAARELWPEGWDAPKPYIRIVPQPLRGGWGRLLRPLSLQALQPLPVLGDPLAAQRRERDVGVGLLADEALLDRHEPGVLELGQVAGEVALRQPGRALQEQEVGVLDRRQHGEDRQPARLVDQPVDDRRGPTREHCRSRVPGAWACRTHGRTGGGRRRR
jgi:alkyl hydroperoxide reductase subunit AhpC